MRPCPVAHEDDAHRPASRDRFKDQCAAAEALVIGMGRDDDLAPNAELARQTRKAEAQRLHDARIVLKNPSAGECG